MTTQPAAPILSPQQKLEYLLQKLAIVVSEMRAVTDDPWLISATLFHGERHPDLTAVANDAGILRHEWSAETQGGYYSGSQCEGTNITIHDSQMLHSVAIDAQVPA
jgi:hypothetical protein